MFAIVCGYPRLRTNYDSISATFDIRLVSIDLIILAGGARRQIVTSQLNLTPIPVSDMHTFSFSFLNESIGPQILFLRTRDNDTGHWCKTAIVGNEITEEGPILFTQITSSQSTETLAGIASQRINDIKAAYKNENLPEKLTLNTTIPPKTFTAQETKLPKTNVNNIFIVGDAARTGHFQSALGASLGLVFDVAAVREVGETFIRNGPWVPTTTPS
ncbi:hypothetical protein HK104_005593 [Borealophlyctis nickersoniae]|nr:hypothetical protein HK104_005593 [Borealophlyctis nickersoniae]